MAINGLLEQMCEEEGVGFVDLWGYFVGKEDMFMRDGLHLSGKGAAVFSENLLRSMNNGTGCNVGSGGRAVERRTVNQGDGGSIPPTAVSKLRQFLHLTFACVFRKRH